MIDVILPVLDELDAIPGVLASLPDGFEPIVVDNGSSDGSGACARALGARVVVEPVRGFGAACDAGLRAATADIVCFMDCDGSLHGRDLPRVVAGVQRGDADLVLGARKPTVASSWPVHARLGNWVVTAELRRRTGLQLRDIGPMRAAKREGLLELDLRDRRFGWPLEMVMRAARSGWRVEEVAVPYEPRVGRSKVTGTVRGTLRTARDMAGVLR
jgi:glycosyltransferase involved in cell wall biosynthesis